MRFSTVTFSLCLFFSFVTNATNASLVHTKTLPNEIPYAASDLPNHAIYLEGESLGKKNKADTFPKSHQAITVFRTAAKPNDYWAAWVAYDQSRFASRGANKRNYSKHHLIWENVTQKLDLGIYDVYVRCMITQGGSITFSFKKAADIKSLSDADKSKPTTYKKANISWVRIASINLQKEDDTFELTVSTKQTPVQIDTVLLVKKPSREMLPLKIKRLPNPKAASDRPGGLIFATEKATITYDIQAPEKLLKTSVEIVGFDGQIIQKNNHPVITPVNNKTSRLTVSLPSRGYFSVTLDAITKANKTVKITTVATVLGVPIDDALRMKSRFGLWTVSGDKPLLKAANGRWNRRLMTLHRIKESALSTEGSTQADILTPAAQATLKTYDWTGALSFGLPNWLMGISPEKSHKGFGNAFYPPKDWAQLDKALDYYFQKNKNRLPSIMEVYNEPKAHWKGTQQGLVKFHQAVARSLKKIRPDIKVFGPCFYSIRTSELEQLADLGLFDTLDGIVMHAYINNSTPEEIFLDRLTSLAAFRNRPKYKHLPIFLTEFGWTSNEGTWQIPVDELTQAQFCARSLALCVSENIDAMIYFCLEFRAKGLGEAGFSLIAPTGRPKPGFAAFSTIARLFADAKPVTRLKLTPSVFMVVAKRSDHYVASLWSTSKNHTIKLPFAISSATNMVGQPIAINQSNSFTVTPSPIYLTMASFPINQPKKTTNIQRLQGQDLLKNENHLFAFDLNWYNPQGKLQIPSNTKPGEYVLLKKDGNQWETQTITIKRPFNITSTKIDWPLEQKTPSLRVTLTSNIDIDTLPIELSFQANQSQPISTTCQLPPHTIRQVLFDLKDFSFGQHLESTLSASTLFNHKTITLITQKNITVVAAVLKDKVKTWDQVQPMDFTNWKPFRKLDNSDPTKIDCAAQLKCRYTEKALELLVRVQDDEHRQIFATKNPSRMWAQDSLQIAFDMDIDKPWAAGVGGQDSLGGHRVFEFNIGKKAGHNTGIAFRHTSYNKNLPANMIERDIKTQVTRIADITTYHITIPWPVLDFENDAASGKRIGFSLLVNDVDPKAKRKRHGLQLFTGIAESKDPKQYGPMWLR